MRKTKLFMLIPMLMSMGLAACTNSVASSTAPSSSSAQPSSSKPSSSSKSSTSAASSKTVTITSIKLGNEDGKAYVLVDGTQTNYTAEEFTWAWGLRVRNGDFVNGKETPAATDFKTATFDASSKSFSLKYCLTDLDLTSGSFYEVYGGTPISYGLIEFTNTNTGARDATRSYYLRTDEGNSIVFDSIQPIKFTKASIVNNPANLPAGKTEGLYIKFGGVNEANLTTDIIAGWEKDGKVAGNFQRVIGGDYQVHTHTADERFYTIEGEDVFFYCYIGFIASGEGWMTHFDCVSGNSTANLQFDNSIWGGAENTYTVGNDIYRVYADNKSHGSKETEFWGCLGVTRNAEA